MYDFPNCVEKYCHWKDKFDQEVTKNLKLATTVLALSEIHNTLNLKPNKNSNEIKQLEKINKTLKVDIQNI